MWSPEQEKVGKGKVSVDNGTDEEIIELTDVVDSGEKKCCGGKCSQSNVVKIGDILLRTEDVDEILRESDGYFKKWLVHAITDPENEGVHNFLDKLSCMIEAARNQDKGVVFQMIGDLADDLSVLTRKTTD